MKKLFFLLILSIILGCTTHAQYYRHGRGHQRHDGPYTWSLGISALYSYYGLSTGNLGVSVQSTACINENWKVYWLSTINGLPPKNEFNRVGMSTVGGEFHFLQYLYAFTDFGLVVDPSADVWHGLVVDAGLGSEVHLTRRLLAYTRFSTYFTPQMHYNLSMSIGIGLALKFE